MVAVAAGAVAYNPWSAVIIGAIAALSFLLWSKLLIKLHVDDPVETAAGKAEEIAMLDGRSNQVPRFSSSYRWRFVGYFRSADLSPNYWTQCCWRFSWGCILLDHLSHRRRRELAGKTSLSFFNVILQMPRYLSRVYSIHYALQRLSWLGRRSSSVFYSSSWN